jgi:ubiquinone/menaquinone biosynthesis C-methylase UbiE
MNAAEHWICSSSLWRYFTQRQLLPRILADVPLGDHLLEIGAGYGPATSFLKAQVSRVTSLEYDHNATLKLKLQSPNGDSAAVRGDASQLPFPGQTFSSSLAIFVLHHLKSLEAQERMFSEVFRILRPGGVFVALEINDTWINRFGHIRSTFTPVPPASIFPRLAAAGFSQTAVDFRPGIFRINAFRPAEALPSTGSSC